MQLGMYWNVSEYGAIGDGRTMDTAAIQRAIDDCSNDGGGVVFFPRGIYLSGILHLKSNITLHLTPSAVLLGSADAKDYLQENTGSGFVKSGYFLFADGVENVAITGQGIIDGSGSEFWIDETINQVRNLGPIIKPKPDRPRALLYMVNCRNILLIDLTFRNSPCYTVWLLGCDVVNIDRITIDNPLHGPNTDGIDIDCCGNVHVANCHISAGDDAIALKSDAYRLGRKKPCENITVTNCTFISRACGVRVGYEGDAEIKNCCFTGIIIRDTDIGLSVVSILPNTSDLMPVTVESEHLQIKEGCRIEGIVFSDVVMENINRPFHFWLGTETTGEHKGYIRSILISNIIARVNNTAYIEGMPDKPVESVTFTNVKLLIQGNMDGVKYPEESRQLSVWGFEPVPMAFYLRHTRNISLRDVEIVWEDSASGNWTNALFAEDSWDLEINGFRGRQYEINSDTPAIQLNNIDNAFIHDCSALPGTGVYVSLSGKRTHNITMANNNLREAKLPVKTDDEFSCNAESI